jgi:hypothetical protein
MGAETDAAADEIARAEARLEALANELRDIAIERDNLQDPPLEVDETKLPEEAEEFAPSSDGEEIMAALPSRATITKAHIHKKENPFTAFHDAIEEEKTAGRQMALTDDDIRRFVSKSKSEGAQMRVWKKDEYGGKHRLYDNSKFFTALGQQVAANRLGFKPPEPVEWKQSLETIKSCQALLPPS